MFWVSGKWTGAHQFFQYDFWWHLGFDTLLSSEWGTPNMIENGVQPDLLLRQANMGIRYTFGICAAADIIQTLDLGQGATNGSRDASRA